MALRWRAMQPKDIRECAGIIAQHSVIGPRYGRTIRDLRTAWLRLLGCEGMTTALFEEVEGDRRTTWGLGVAVFVNDAFMREMRTPPLFWFGPELAKRVVRGTSPVLSDTEVREANSGEGLNLLVWEGAVCREFADRSEVYHLMVSAFLALHRGFLLKEMITSQVESVPRAQWAVDGGGYFWDPTNAQYLKSPRTTVDDFVREPHIVGTTRELEAARPGSWVGALFDYRRPRFGFCPSEQRLLRVALGGNSGTDQELAKTLGVSLPTVKKTWLSIYGRVAECEPEWIADYSQADDGASGRGKEKRRRLLAYLRDCPEELRPVSRKRLQQNRPLTKSVSSRVTPPAIKSSGRRNSHSGR